VLIGAALGASAARAWERGPFFWDGRRVARRPRFFFFFFWRATFCRLSAGRACPAHPCGRRRRRLVGKVWPRRHRKAFVVRLYARFLVRYVTRPIGGRGRAGSTAASVGNLVAVYGTGGLFFCALVPTRENRGFGT